MITGIGVSGSIFWVAALNALQNSMMLRPRWPRAGPIGGEGLAFPAGTCSLMYPSIFFAISRPQFVIDSPSPTMLSPTGPRYGHGGPAADLRRRPERGEPRPGGRRIQTFSTCEYSSSTGVERPKIDT